jgi:hypothetical protein
MVDIADQHRISLPPTDHPLGISSSTEPTGPDDTAIAIQNPASARRGITATDAGAQDRARP